MPGMAISPAPMIASAAARNTAGFIAVCRPRSIASSDAPAWPLLKCSPICQFRDAANSAAARFGALEAVERDPARLVRIPVRRDVIAVAGPTELPRGLAIAIVGLDRVGHVALKELGVPHLARREIGRMEV